VLGDFWHINPRWVISPGERLTVRLYFAAGGGAPIYLAGPQGPKLIGFETPKYLPEAGGQLDQAAIMIDAAALIRHTIAAWQAFKEGR
jgi:hypothetical protein